MRSKNIIKKVMSFVILSIIVLTNMLPVYAVSFEENKIIKLETDHECISVLKYKDRDVLKNIFYVFYKEPETGEKCPAFCVEPEKNGIGTSGMNNYEVSLKVLKDERLWRILYKGYMGSTYKDFNLECDDDLYYATKVAVHCLVEGVSPKERYEVPHRVGKGENVSLEEVQRRGAKVLEISQKIYDYGINGKETYAKPSIKAVKKYEPKIENINNTEYYVFYYELNSNRDIEKCKINIENFPEKTKVFNMENKEIVELSKSEFKLAIPTKNIKKDINGIIKIIDAKIKTYPVFYANAYSEEYQDYITYADKVENISSKQNLEINAYQSTIKIVKLEEETQKPIKGVKFSAKYLDTNEEIGQFTTDEKGEIIINKLRQGEIGITEIETVGDYKIDTDTKKIELGFKQDKEIKIYNKLKKGKLKVIKVDKDDSNIKLEGVKFNLLNEKKEGIKELTTNENGEIELNNLIIGKYYLKEIETDKDYVLNEEIIEIRIEDDKISEIIVQNEKIKGQIQIEKISEDRNNILDKEVGSPIANAKFNIYKDNGKLVEQIITNKDGIALSSKLEKGKYAVQEVETGKWYILDDKKYNAEINKNEEIVKLKITNKSQNPKVDILKKCKSKVKANEEINYTFDIKNVGNVALSNFTWYDMLPYKYAKITKIETGTYNQDINYSIYYKTNKKDEYMIIKKELNSKENNYIDLTKLYLAEGEEITEIKVCFGNVGIGFESVDKPHIFMKVKDGMNNDEKIENYTLLEGYNQEYKVSDEDTATSIVHNVVEPKKLPRTGF